MGKHIALGLCCLLVIMGPASGEEVRPGVLRTPDERFENLPDYNFEPHYIEIKGFRIHYLDEGPPDADPVLLMHGEPTWAFLYRKFIPILTAAGHRCIVPDMIGFGRSDKPAKREDYSYKLHVDIIAELIERLDLKNITLFCQDWGALVALRVAGENEDRFARLIAANGGLPVGDQPDGTIIGAEYTEPDPNAKDIKGGSFREWVKYSQTAPILEVGGHVQVRTVTDLSDEVVAAYDAPYPSEEYKAGARVMPTLVASQSTSNQKAWGVLQRWEKPFLTLFSDQDPVGRGGDKRLQESIPGAKGQAHQTIKDAGHNLQEDKGEELARIMVKFIADNPLP